MIMKHPSTVSVFSLYGFYVYVITVVVIMLGDGANCEKPSEVRIGAIFTFNSVIGKAAKAAIQMAVDDVNADPRILGGTELKLIMEDANCSVFMGSIETFKVIEKEVVAIIGPQSSAIAHMISEIGSNLQVPLVSFAATDPTLSVLQFPYFVRTAQSDSYQMTAMADLIDLYGWKEVIAVFVDDDFGRNGIASLGDELEKKLIRISHKLPIPVQLDVTEIASMLNESKTFGPRIYVVHTNPDPSLKIFKIAKELQMMESDYVWLATDWLSTTLDSLSPINQSLFSFLFGVVSLRQHAPDSIKKKTFMRQWTDMQQKGNVSSPLNMYGLCAYDSVWTIALAIDKFLKENGNITFLPSDKLSHRNSTMIQLSKLKVFNEGASLLRHTLLLNFTGLTGQVRFNPDRNVLNSGYEVLNVNEKAVHSVGFWSNATGLSISRPETLKGKQNISYSQDQKLKDIVWPGGKLEKPRGWVIADNERPLRIGVPNRFGFTDFVREDSKTHKIEGFCIDVFDEARLLVPYDVPYRFFVYGDGRANPNYDKLVKMVDDDIFDAVVGDIAIVTNRTKLVDFSQPYTSTGLVILAPVDNSKSNAWVFLKPFSAELWCVIVASFVLIALVMWVLEHRVNKAFRGPPRRQLVTIFLFSFSTLFKKNQEDTVSPLGRMVMVVWLFLLMVITSSYTASLSSILTVQQLSSPITGIDSLIASEWPIGYQEGSFIYSYLVDSLYVSPSRLVSLGSPEAYEEKLRLGPHNGGVAAIIEERPYVECFLSTRTGYGIIGREFSHGGWGFAFKRDSPLSVDISTAILKLSESGKLQTIHEKWFCKNGCPADRMQQSESNRLHLISFWGLYLLSGFIALAAFAFFLLRMIILYVRHSRQQRTTTVSSSSQCSGAIHSFLEFIDQKEEAFKKAITATLNSQQPT